MGWQAHSTQGPPLPKSITDCPGYLPLLHGVTRPTPLPFQLKLNERVLGGVATQAHRLLDELDCLQVLLPQRVGVGQHEEPARQADTQAAWRATSAAALSQFRQLAGSGLGGQGLQR